MCEYKGEKKNTAVSKALAIGPAIAGITIHLSTGHGPEWGTTSDFSHSSRLVMVGSLWYHSLLCCISSRIVCRICMNPSGPLPKEADIALYPQ